MDRSDRLRVLCGAATGLAGLAVATAMSMAGGSLARFLPDAPWFHLVALAGAGAAGLALADGFGRRGWRGIALVVGAAPVATAVGAALAAAVLTLCVAAFHALSGSAGLPMGTVTGAPVLGLIAVTDGIGTSPVVAATWVLAMLGVHVAMRHWRVRTVCPTAPPG